MFRKSHKVKKPIKADDLIVGSEISWWFGNILPLGSGLIGMVPIRSVQKYPVTPVRYSVNAAAEIELCLPSGCLNAGNAINAEVLNHDKEENKEEREKGLQPGNKGRWW